MSSKITSWRADSGRERRASKEARRQAAALLLVMLLRSPRNGATQRRHACHAVTAVVAAERRPHPFMEMGRRRRRPAVQLSGTS